MYCARRGRQHNTTIADSVLTDEIAKIAPFTNKAHAHTLTPLYSRGEAVELGQAFDFRLCDLGQWED
jgi:hypothetical protein